MLLPFLHHNLSTGAMPWLHRRMPNQYCDNEKNRKDRSACPLSLCLFVNKLKKRNTEQTWKYVWSMFRIDFLLLARWFPYLIWYKNTKENWIKHENIFIFYRLVLKTTLRDFAFSIVPLVLIDGCEDSENSLHIQDEYNLFFGNEYTSFSEGIYLPEKRYILFRQKHYTFQAKGIYLSVKKYILFFRKK